LKFKQYALSACFVPLAAVQFLSASVGFAAKAGTSQWPLSESSVLNWHASQQSFVAVNKVPFAAVGRVTDDGWYAAEAVGHFRRVSDRYRDICRTKALRTS
jgi:hypothetical protein